MQDLLKAAAFVLCSAAAALALLASPSPPAPTQVAATPAPAAPTPGQAKPEPAPALRDLSARGQALRESLRRLHPDDERTARLLERWDGSLSEIPSSLKRPGYTIGKRDVHICIRDRDGRPFDPDTAFFVLVHELAHVVTKEQQHPPQFWNNMRFLLKVAQDEGIAAIKDYDAHPETYCGYHIASTPMRCLWQRTCDLS